MRNNTRGGGWEINGTRREIVHAGILCSLSSSGGDKLRDNNQ